MFLTAGAVRNMFHFCVGRSHCVSKCESVVLLVVDCRDVTPRFPDVCVRNSEVTPAKPHASTSLGFGVVAGSVLTATDGGAALILRVPKEMRQIPVRVTAVILSAVPNIAMGAFPSSNGSF